MKQILEYRDINHTMSKLIYQVNDSINFMRNFLPAEIETAEELFYFLKPQLIFINDPPDRELLQTSQTLFNNNPHGISGAGDCDCFSITGLAALYVLQIPAQIVLAGRNLRAPVHIYLMVKNSRDYVPFDLTQPTFDNERPYKYKFYYQAPFKYKKGTTEGQALKKNHSESRADSDFLILRKKYLPNYLTF